MPLSGEGVCFRPLSFLKAQHRWNIPLWNVWNSDLDLGSILRSGQDEVLWFEVGIFRMVTMCEGGRKTLKMQLAT